MNFKVDPLRKSFAPMLDKTLKNALAHRMAQDFPRIGGERIRQLCADMMLEIVNQHLRPRDLVGHGQVVWPATNARAILIWRP